MTLLNAVIATAKLADIKDIGLPPIHKALEIIDYFKPRSWFMENPHHGRLKEFIDLPHYVVDYCQYADFGYRKRTCIWTDLARFEPKLCRKGNGLFFAETLRDRGLDYYFYDTWAGYMLVAMNIFLLVVFLILMRRTYVFEKRVVKRNFYRRFACIYTLWFLTTPILVLIARLVSPHFRAVVLFGFERIVQVLAFLSIPMLQRPKNSFDVYGATDLHDARIPSVSRQLRVQAMAIELPRSQGAGDLSGMPPPVNRNMTTDLDEADRRAVALHEISNEGMAGGSEGVTAVSAGEGIIEY